MFNIAELINFTNLQSTNLWNTYRKKVEYYSAPEYKAVQQTALTKYHASREKKIVLSRKIPGEESGIEPGLLKTTLLKSHIVSFSISSQEEVILSTITSKTQQLVKDNELSEVAANFLGRILVEYIKNFIKIEIDDYQKHILQPLLNVLESYGRLGALTAQDFATLLQSQKSQDIKLILNYKPIDQKIKDKAVQQIISLKAKTIKITQLRELIKMLPKGGIAKMFEDAPDELLTKFLNNIFSNDSISDQNKQSVILRQVLKTITEEKLVALCPLWMSFVHKRSSDVLEDEIAHQDIKFSKTKSGQADEGYSSPSTSPTNTNSKCGTPVSHDSESKVDFIPIEQHTASEINIIGSDSDL